MSAPTEVKKLSEILDAYRLFILAEPDGITDEEALAQIAAAISQTLDSCRKDSPDYDDDRDHYKDQCYSMRDLVLENNETIDDVKAAINEWIGGE